MVQPLCTNCQKPGGLVCAGCLLVTYCGATCQKVHWKRHKHDCKSELLKTTWEPQWVREDRKPSWYSDGHRLSGKFLWGNMPAIDVLRLEANEGVGYEGDLKLLFAASGDLRNIVKTIAAIPQTYRKRRVHVTINDNDFDVVARNIILLLINLLVVDTDTAIDSMIHVWYLAFIPRKTAEVLATIVRPYIERACSSMGETKPGCLKRIVFRFLTRTLDVSLPKEMWFMLRSYFETKITKEAAQHALAAATMAPSLAEDRERLLSTHMPAHRLSWQRFHEDGLLLPFGASRETFVVPNPTLFRAGKWAMSEGVDPLYGWQLSEVLATSSGPAKNDLYGKMHHHVRDQLLSFRQRLNMVEVDIKMYSMDAFELHKFCPITTFARIDVSNACDGFYLGTHKTLAALGRLLQVPNDNPHATLLGLYMNAVGEITTTYGIDLSEARQEFGLAARFLDFDEMASPKFGAKATLVTHAHSLLRECDKYFERYLELLKFREIENTYHLSMKDRNTIIDKWPTKFKMLPGQPGAKEAFMVFLASACQGQERYVEWKWAS